MYGLGEETKEDLPPDMVKMLSMGAIIQANPQYQQDFKDLEAEATKKIAAGASKEEMQQRGAECISSLPDALVTRPARAEEVEGFIDCVRLSTGMEPKYNKESKISPWILYGGAAAGVGLIIFLIRR